MTQLQTSLELSPAGTAYPLTGVQGDGDAINSGAAGGTFVSDQTAAAIAAGNFCGLWTAPATSASFHRTWTISTADLSFRIYIYITAYPGAGWHPITAAAAAVMGQVRITTTGTVACIVGSTIAATTTGTIPLNTLVRIEGAWHFATNGTGTFQLNCYSGHSTTPLANLSHNLTGQTYNAALATAVRFGVTGGGPVAPWSFRTDGWATDDTGAAIGPMVAPVVSAALSPTATASAGLASIITGTAAVAATAVASAGITPLLTRLAALSPTAAASAGIMPSVTRTTVLASTARASSTLATLTTVPAPLTATAVAAAAVQATPAATTAILAATATARATLAGPVTAPATLTATAVTAATLAGPVTVPAILTATAATAVALAGPVTVLATLTATAVATATVAGQVQATATVTGGFGSSFGTAFGGMAAAPAPPPPPPPPRSPQTVPGLMRWSRADDFAVVGDGAQFTSGAVGDRVTVGATWAPGTAGSGPTYHAAVAALNNQPTLEFDGTVPDALAETGTTDLPGSGFSVWAVALRAATGGGTTPALLSEDTTAAPNRVMQLGYGNASNIQMRMVAFATSTGTTRIDTELTTFAKATPVVFTGLATTTSSEAFINGTSSSGPTTTPTGLYVTTGRRLIVGAAETTSATYAYAGHIAEWGVYDHPLTAAERATLHSYVQDRYGITVSDYVPATTTPNGTGGGTWTFVGTAVGKRTPKATAGGAWAFTGTAVGKRVPEATAGGTWMFVSTAVGAQPAVPIRQGSGGGSWAFVGAATGRRTPKAAGTGAWAFTGTATGRRAPQATAGGTWTFTGAAVGVRPIVGVKQGTGAGAWAFASTAVGRRTPKATAGGVWTFAGAATGKRVPKAAATSVWTFVGAGAGRRVPKATAVSSWAFVGVSRGRRVPKAAATGTWTFVGRAVGTGTTGILVLRHVGINAEIVSSVIIAEPVSSGVITAEIVTHGIDAVVDHS